MTNRAFHIDQYITSLFAPEDTHLLNIKQEAKENGLPPIEISPSLGKLLHCLIKLKNPQRVLEIGTLSGYSTMWIARALPEGAKLLSLEINPYHALLAKKHLSLDQLDCKVEVLEGNALDLMDTMIQNKEEPFEFIFIDADKENYALYLDKAIILSRPGSIILTDNLIPKGDQIGTPENTQAISVYAFNQKLASHPRLDSSLIPTVADSNGRLDAIALSIVKP